MTSNILVLPFRRTHSVSLSEPIKQYISNKYDQHPSMFNDDLAEIDKIRASAVNCLEPHASGIKKLQAYAAQLVWMAGKFPIDIGADFTWYPALGYNTETAVSRNSIRFELANVLFNLAVMYCQLAVTSNRSTAEGLKIASNYFCHSAGVIAHLKSTVVPEMNSTPPEDMDVMTLESVEQLLLAQAQECFWQKAVKDGLKDNLIARLAAKVSDFYAQAADFGIKSESISSQWIHHMTAKHHHFAAAAQYRASCDCLDKRKYGEEVARLRDSLVCVNEALKESRYINKVVLGDLNGLKNKVQEDLKRAEKDNDIIYLVPVPPKSELKPLDRASMVSAKIPVEVSDPISMLGDGRELGRSLFNKLVPYSVHIAASIYADRRDKTVSSIVDELEALNTRIHDLLRSLSLPGSLQALEKPLGLPGGLVSHAEEVRQQNGVDRLFKGMDDVAKLKNNDLVTFQEGVNFLQSEAAEDQLARKKYGTDRWTRPESQAAAQRLYGQVTELEGYLKTAESSDNTVRSGVQAAEPLLRLLNGTDRELENYVPSSRRVKLAPNVEQEVGRLRRCLDELSRFEIRRKRKIESLKTKGQADDVSSDLLREVGRLEREWPMQKIEAVQFESFFDERLKRYDVDEDMVKQERREQERLLSGVAEANTSFQTVRRGDVSNREREQALQKLENTYFQYKELVQNLDVGRKFYNDLATHMGKFRDDCRTFAYQRRSEAAQLEADITTALPLANLSLHASSPPLTAATAQQQQSVESVQPSNDVTAHRGMYTGPGRVQDALAAPIPVKPASTSRHIETQGSALPGPTISGIWNPEAGIKFAQVTTPNGGISHSEGESTAPGPRRATQWDPTQGLRFG